MYVFMLFFILFFFVGGDQKRIWFTLGKSVVAFYERNPINLHLLSNLTVLWAGPNTYGSTKGHDRDTAFQLSLYDLFLGESMVFTGHPKVLPTWMVSLAHVTICYRSVF